MVDTVRSLGIRALRSAVACALALGLALLSAHLYQAPHLIGKASQKPGPAWDVVCALASSALALAVGLGQRPLPARSASFGSTLSSVVRWFALTCLLWLIWEPYVFLSTLAIAPTHALAALRLWSAWRSYRTERAWRRPN